MFELIVAYILYVTEAGPWWWTAFAAILMLDFYLAVRRGYLEG